MKVSDNSWRLKSWQVPYLGNLELTHVSNLTHEYPRHVHEEYCLAIVLKGVETHVCRGQSYDAVPGDVMLLNAEEAHSSRSARSEYRVIHIPPDALDQIGSEITGRKIGTPYFSDPVIKDRELFRSLLNLHLKLERDAPSLEHESELISTIGSLLLRLTELSPHAPPSRKDLPHVKPVQDYLKFHFAENVSLSKLAAIANMSRFHFLRTFRDLVGVPPHEYQTQLRVARAKKLIQKGHSISHAAYESGFFDQSHLTRNFKRIVGVTPGKYLSQSNIVQEHTKPA